MDWNKVNMCPRCRDAGLTVTSRRVLDMSTNLVRRLLDSIVSGYDIRTSEVCATAGRDRPSFRVGTEYRDFHAFLELHRKDVSAVLEEDDCCCGCLAVDLPILEIVIADFRSGVVDDGVDTSFGCPLY